MLKMRTQRDIDDDNRFRAQDALTIAEGQRDPLSLHQTKAFYTQTQNTIDWDPVRPMKINDMIVSGKIAVAYVTYTQNSYPDSVAKHKHSMKNSIKKYNQDKLLNTQLEITL